jgi:hypothetical protein
MVVMITLGGMISSMKIIVIASELNIQTAKGECDYHGNLLVETNLDGHDNVYWKYTDYKFRNNIYRRYSGPEDELFRRRLLVRS